MPYFVESGGAFKRVIAGWVGPAGDWKRVLGRWVGVDGVWKLKFAAGTVALAPATIRGFAYDPDVPQARVDFTSDGKVNASFTDQTVNTTQEIARWYDPLAVGAGAGFEIRAIRIAGLGIVTGDVLDAWLAMDDVRGWEVLGSGGSYLNRTRAATLQIEIRPTGGSQLAATAQFTLSTTTYGASNPNGSYGKGGGIDKVSPYRFQLL